ncbi:helix-turn-helix domain-containing protein [Cystobacter fuscus]|uniref:helix-turn-helix domain-containing protein n=1 Tax=Cystobacter fuscus TaxID=43 RepID=UPI0037C09E18
MHHTTDTATPSFSLSRYVEDVREFESAAGSTRHDWLPDGRTVLVFRTFEGGLTGDVCVAGPRTRAMFKNTTGVSRALMLQFKPGWSAQLLGVSASALTDHIVPLEELWGRPGDALRLELLAARSPSEVAERLSQAFALRAHHTSDPASARLARRAIRLLEGDEVRVERVAEQLGVTARHLRRAFTESVGIGPKDFARSVRLRRAMQLAATSKEWGRIALEAGYYDQAHLIGDFRELVGFTPSAFVKRAEGGGVRCGPGGLEASDFQPSA